MEVVMGLRRSLNAARHHAHAHLLACTLAAALVVAALTCGAGYRSANATASATSTHPSGVAIPTVVPRGWRKVFADDFTGSTLASRGWFKYLGQPGGDPAGWFDPKHVSVSSGELVIKGYRDGGKWATGGIRARVGQTYGKYLVRFRFDKGTGVEHTILLWPAAKRWPPEVDFSEDNGGNRQTTYSTLHYGTSNHMIHRQVAVDLTKWHTLGVAWTPGKLVYTLDGSKWGTVTSPHVPSIPMVLGIQTQAWASGINNWEHGVDSTTPTNVNLYVDWVVVYARA
jgi:hypothetical protein